MKKWGVVGVVLLLAFVLMACEKKAVGVEGVDNEKYDDLLYVVETLEREHKDFYNKVSEADFKLAVDEIAKKTPNMSDAEFYYALRELLSLAGDAHTMLYFDNNYAHLKALGFAVEKFSDGWRLVILEVDNSAYLGHKLVKINKVPIDEVFERAKTIISYENETWAMNQFSNTINFYDALVYLEVVEEGAPVVLTVEKEAKALETITLVAHDEESMKQIKLAYASQKVLGKTSPSGYYSALPLDADAYYIQYNQCAESPNLSMKDFTQQVSDQIREQPYKKVIIDLRYNFGGNSNVFAPMLTALSTLQREMGFEVYTLIGKNTFSSAVINAVQIDKMLDNTFVGMPTGSNVNHFGEIQTFKLKSHPIEVYYSIKYFELVKGYEKDSLYPDVTVDLSYEDYISGIDRAVETVLERGDQ